MKLYSDSDTLVSVQWFFTDDDPLPFPTVFNSRNWLSEKSREYPLGERKAAPREWANGAEPPWHKLGVLCTCWDDPVKAVQGGSVNGPFCPANYWCDPAVVVGRTRRVLPGKGFPRAPAIKRQSGFPRGRLIAKAAAFPQGLPILSGTAYGRGELATPAETFTVEFSGIENHLCTNCDNFNDTFQLQRDSGNDNWTYYDYVTCFNGFVLLLRYITEGEDAPYVEFAVVFGIDAINYRAFQSWDKRSQVTLDLQEDLTFSTKCQGWADTITVTPA